MAEPTLFESLQITGAAGWLVLLLTIGLVPAGVFCAVLRVPRAWATALLLAALLPLGVGFLGMLAGQVRSARVIESLAAPTPADLAVGVREAQQSLMLGLASTLVCLVPALVSLARSKGRDDGATP